VILPFKINNVAIATGNPTVFAIAVGLIVANANHFESICSLLPFNL
jgi:hypothetical protein